MELLSYLIILLFSLLHHFSSPFELECEYHEWTGWGYGCLVTKGTIRDHTEATITSINGKHMEDYDDSKVVWVSIESRVMKNFPKNFGNFFKNLTTIYLAKSQLREILLDDFETLELLKNLFLDHNEVTKVDVRAFERLSKLRSLSFEYNKCHSNSVYYNRTAVLTLIGELKAKCYNKNDNIAITTTTTTSSSTTVESDDETTDADDEEIDLEMKIVKLENQVKEIAKLRATIVSYEEQIVDLSARIEQLKTNEEQLVELQKENQIFKKELSLRNREIANLKSENANLGTRVSRCDTENGQQRIQIKDLKSEIDNMKSKISNFEKEGEEMKNLRETLSECKDETITLEEKIEKLSMNIDELNLSADELKEEIVINLSQISTLEDTIDLLKAQFDECGDDKSQHLMNIENIQLEMVKCESRISNKDKEIENLKDDLKRLENVQVDLKNCKTGLSNYDAQLIKLINENGKLKANITQCVNESSITENLMEISQSCKDEKAAVSLENDKLRNNVSDLQHDHSQLKTKIEELTQSISDCNNLRFQLGSLKVENTNLRTLITRCENELVECNEAPTNNNCDEKTSQIENLRNTIALNDATISTMLIDSESQKERIAHCDQQVSSAFSENEILRSSLSLCDSEMTRCDSKLTRISMENENLKSSLSNFEIRLASLMGENQRLAQTAISTVEFDNIRASLSATHEAQILINNLSNENENLTNLLARCETEIFNLSDDVNLLEKFQEQLKDYILQTEATLEKCRNNNLWCFNTYCGRINTWNH